MTNKEERIDYNKSKYKYEEIEKLVSVQKNGDTLMISIPKQFAKQLDIDIRDILKVTIVEGNKLVYQLEGKFGLY